MRWANEFRPSEAEGWIARDSISLRQDAIESVRSVTVEWKLLQKGSELGSVWAWISACVLQLALKNRAASGGSVNFNEYGRP